MNDTLTPEERAERSRLKTETFAYRFGSQDRASWPEEVRQNVDRYHALSHKMVKQEPRGTRTETHTVKWVVQTSFYGNPFQQGPHAGGVGGMHDTPEEANASREYVKKLFGHAHIKTRVVRVETTETVVESDPFP